MIEEGKFGMQEAISLLIITMSIKVYFTSPSFIAVILGTSSWYMTLISAATAMLGFSFLCLLLKRFPGRNLIEAFDLSMGRAFGFLFSMILILFLLGGTAILVREFAEVLKIYSLPTTPPTLLIGTLLFVTTITCFMGLEGITRSARLMAYFILVGFLVVIVLASTHYDYHNLFPILGYGLDRTILYGLSRSSFYGEVILLGLIAPSLQGLTHIKRAGLISIGVSGILVSVALAAGMMAFNFGTAQEMTSQMYELARIIHIGGFLQRLDPSFLFTWCIGTLISVSFLQYCTISAYCKTFRIPDIRVVILPMTIVLFTTCMVPLDLTSITQYVHITRQLGWIVYFGLPLVVWIVAAIRKKGGAENA